jgi:hypothetical protein
MLIQLLERSYTLEKLGLQTMTATLLVTFMKRHTQVVTFFSYLTHAFKIKVKTDNSSDIRRFWVVAIIDST